MVCFSYMKLQKKLPASMLTCYHCWIYENHKIESVEILKRMAYSGNRVSD